MALSTRPEERVKHVEASHRVVAVASIMVVAAASVVLAADPPHWSSTTISMDCTTPCHVTHHAAGGTLTDADSNANLCQSCHNPTGVASGMPVNAADAAVPGVRGTSHAFGVPAVNATYGAQLPLDGEMQLRVMDGDVVCSTCHDQHTSASAFGGTPRVRPAKMVTALGSIDGLNTGGTFNGSNGLWYLVEIVQAGTQSTARFCYSKDNGISWTPTGCDPPGGTFIPNLSANGSTPVALDNGVDVSFDAGSYVQGERWEFAAAWPFLRAELVGPGGDGSAMCRDCHRDWDMDHVATATWDGGFKSHPIGIGLGANGGGYDRSPPLDGNGAPQGDAAADAVASNDLTLDANGNIHCMTCHGVHFVDSNTITEDGP